MNIENIWKVNPAIRRLTPTTGKLFFLWNQKSLPDIKCTFSYFIQCTLTYVAHQSECFLISAIFVIRCIKSSMLQHLVDGQNIECCSLLHASAVRKGQSCCNDQDISQWEIKTVHYFLVLQNVCQGLQGLQVIQSPICKGRQKKKKRE